MDEAQGDRAGVEGHRRADPLARLNLDIANPNDLEDTHEDPDTLLAQFDKEHAAAALREELRKVLAAALLPDQR